MQRPRSTQRGTQPTTDRLQADVRVGPGRLRLAAILASAATAIGAGAAGASELPARAAGAGSLPPTSKLTITIAASASPDAATQVWTLRCGPPGGRWAASAEVCARLSRPADRAVLRPFFGMTRDWRSVAKQPLRIRGAAAERPVDLQFNAKGSLTEARRYAEVRRLLGESALRAAEREARRRR